MDIKIQEKLRETIIIALIAAIQNGDMKMMEALAWVSHPVTLQLHN